MSAIEVKEINTMTFLSAVYGLTVRSVRYTANSSNVNITSVDAKFYFTVVTPAINASRSLQTPWPMVATLFFISLCFAAYALHKVPSDNSIRLSIISESQPLPSSWRRFKEGAIYTFHLFRGIFSIILLIQGLASKRYLGPGVGLILNQANLLLSACQIDPKKAEPATYHLGVSVACVGMLLNFGNWILA